MDRPSKLSQIAGCSFSTTVSVLFLMYIGFALVHGFLWAATLSDTYGLLIIRLFVTVVLGALSLFTLPFEGGFLFETFLGWSLYVAPVAAAVGLVIGIASPARQPAPTRA